jgi:hypothetical protein
MVKLWSELPRARLQEMAADLATGLWVGFWLNFGLGLYAFLAGFAEAGRIIRGGGENLGRAGRTVAEALDQVPLVGEGLGRAIVGGFDGAGRPLISFGVELEQLLIILAALIGLLVLAVTLVPWLTRYLPWRTERLARIRSAHRAIRRAPDIPKSQLERILATRALNRLDYETLLEYSPDPIGDWAAGRNDRLARAEMESVGLRP